MMFDSKTAKVRENVTLTVRADPWSTVYLLIEDKKNRLLGIYNDIYQDEVNI